MHFNAALAIISALTFSANALPLVERGAPLPGIRLAPALVPREAPLQDMELLARAQKQHFARMDKMPQLMQRVPITPEILEKRQLQQRVPINHKREIVQQRVPIQKRDIVQQRVPIHQKRQEPKQRVPITRRSQPQRLPIEARDIPEISIKAALADPLLQTNPSIKLVTTGSWNSGCEDSSEECIRYPVQ